MPRYHSHGRGRLEMRFGQRLSQEYYELQAATEDIGTTHLRMDERLDRDRDGRLRDALKILSGKVGYSSSMLQGPDE